MKKLMIIVFIFLCFQIPQASADRSGGGGSGFRNNASSRADNSEKSHSSSGGQERSSPAPAPARSAAPAPQPHYSAPVRTTVSDTRRSGTVTPTARTAVPSVSRQPQQYRTTGSTVVRPAAAGYSRQSRQPAVVTTHRPAAAVSVVPAAPVSMGYTARPVYGVVYSRPQRSLYRRHRHYPYAYFYTPPLFFSYPYYYPYSYYPFFTTPYLNTYYVDSGVSYDSGIQQQPPQQQQTSGAYTELNELVKKQYHYEADMESLSGINVTDVQFSNNPTPVLTLTVTNNSRYAILNIAFECEIKDGGTSFGQTFDYSLPEVLRPGKKMTYTIDLQEYREWNTINLSPTAQMTIYVDGITNDRGTAVPQDIFTAEDQQRMDTLKKGLGITDNN